MEKKKPVKKTVEKKKPVKKTVKKKKVKKCYLGGTLDSKWRDELIPMLKIDYFNPVVKEWTEECKEEEIKQRELCDYCLYVITPKMTGVYSIAEAVDDSNKRPKKTLFCYLERDEHLHLKDSALKSLVAVGDLIKNNGGEVFTSLRDVYRFLNKK